MKQQSENQFTLGYTPVSAGPAQAMLVGISSATDVLIVNAEKTEKTGWGFAGAENEGRSCPKASLRYHNQFARFRGYALFDSDDAGMLPWNTTKTDVDEDNPIWLDTRDLMAATMRPVIDFLNLVDGETQLPQSERVLTAALMTAVPQPIARVTRSQRFEFPKGLRKPGPKLTTIQYKKEKLRVEELQEAMGTSSARDTGDASFENTYKKHVRKSSRPLAGSYRQIDYRLRPAKHAERLMLCDATPTP